MRLRRLLSTILGLTLALALAGCQSGAAPALGPSAGPAAAPPAAEQPRSEAPAAAPVPDATFTAMIDELRQAARKRGISEATLSSALNALAPIPRVVELDKRQPEFSQTFWRYLGGMVTEGRTANGRAMMQKHAALLSTLEKTYGVPGRFLVAFWGLETDFGRDSGSYPVMGALATLAYDGRRGQMFRDEMLNALLILDRGHITLARMKGSWAGAMGQTQFMPSTFLKYAVDQDGDGRKDIWSSVPDALSSAANYLKGLGWDGKKTWGREVRLPPKFDASLASLDVDGLETTKPLSEWAALGVRRADGGPLPKLDISGAVLLPAGIHGPAFLVYDDYRAIVKWNRSMFYAISVGHLADRLGGAGPFLAPARTDPPLKRDEITVLQRGLAVLGLLKNTPDGVIGAGTRQAVRQFQRSAGLPADGYTDAALIEAVRMKSGITP